MPRILGISAVSANRALNYWNKEIAWAFRLHGYDADVVDASDNEGIKHLYHRLQTEEFDFCFGAQGVGSNLMVGEQNLWSLKRTPFIGLHFDHPCHNIFNHANLSPYVANLYFFESFRDVHKRYIRTTQIIDALPFHTYSVPPEASLPFRQRPIKLLFIKSGQSTEECIATLNSLAPAMRDDIWDQLKRIGQDPNLDMCELVDAVFTRRSIDRKTEFALFWGIVHWMDIYVRRQRAIDFLNWLKFREGAVIIGDGWDFIDKEGARAAFRPSIDGGESYNLYGQTQIVCNTNPYGRDLIHERAVFALFNNCDVISDTNAWWGQHFAGVPAVTLFDWQRDLDEQISPSICNLDLAEEAAIAARAIAQKTFANHPFVDKMIETANAVRRLVESNDF